jgi:hypothetical protein
VIASNVKGGRLRLALLVSLLVLFAAACGNREDQAQKDAAFKIERMPDQDRDLNQTELDSLRAMKITHHIVRDEYWDMKGGVIGNDRMEVWYPGRKVYIIQAMATLKQMDEVAEQINKSFGRLPSEKLVVVCAPDMDTFRKATGRDWWHYSLIKGDTLSFQTPMTLFMRGLLTVAARQEYSRWALNRMTNGKAPQWTVWGMSAYLANERDVLRGQRKEYVNLPFRMELDAIEKSLAAETERIDTRRAIYNSYLMVEQLVQTNGIPAVAAFILALGEAANPDAAAQSIFKKSYADVVAQAQSFSEPPLEQAPPAP